MREQHQQQHAQQQSTLEDKLPLLIKVSPGQERKGLVKLFEHGDYNGQTTRYLVGQMLKDENLSVEDKSMVEQIISLLDGGQLLHHGELVEHNPFAYTTLKRTKANEKYHYLELRVIRPEEGGLMYHLP